MRYVISLCLLSLLWAMPAHAQQRFTQLPVVLQSAAGADGDGSEIPVKGYLSVTLQVTGTFSATVNFEGTIDGSTWVALKCVNMASDSRVTTLTAAGLVQCNVQGLAEYRARISSWASGTVTVQGFVLDAVLGSTSGGSGGAGGGDASLAEQQAQTALLTTIDADTGTIAGAMKAEDAAHVSGDTGIFTLCVRNDAGSSLTNATGDYSPIRCNTSGETVTAGIGENNDAAATAGSTGSLSAKLRLMTSQLDSIKTAVELLDNAISGTNIKVQLTDSGDNEIVIPTAGLTQNVASAASTNATSVKASAGTIYNIALINTTATLYYLRLYNLATAPTCSSATGYVTTVPLPASTSGAGVVLPIGIGQAFTTGVAYCITGGPTSTDNTNAAVGIYGMIIYK